MNLSTEEGVRAALRLPHFERAEVARTWTDLVDTDVVDTDGRHWNKGRTVPGLMTVYDTSYAQMEVYTGATTEGVDDEDEKAIHILASQSHRKGSMIERAMNLPHAVKRAYASDTDTSIWMSQVIGSRCCLGTRALLRKTMEVEKLGRRLIHGEDGERNAAKEVSLVLSRPVAPNLPSIGVGSTLPRLTFQLLHTALALHSRFPGWRHNNLPAGLSVVHNVKAPISHTLYTWQCDGKPCAISMVEGDGLCDAILHTWSSFEDKYSLNFAGIHHRHSAGGLVAAAEVIRALAYRLFHDMRAENVLDTVFAVEETSDAVDAEFLNDPWKAGALKDRLLSIPSRTMSVMELTAFANVYDAIMEHVTYEREDGMWVPGTVRCNGAIVNPDSPIARGDMNGGQYLRRVLRDAMLFNSPDMLNLHGVKDAQEAERLREAERKEPYPKGKTVVRDRFLRVDADLPPYVGEGIDLPDTEISIARRGPRGDIGTHDPAAHWAARVTEMRVSAPVIVPAGAETSVYYRST